MAFTRKQKTCFLTTYDFEGIIGAENKEKSDDHTEKVSLPVVHNRLRARALVLPLPVAWWVNEATGNENLLPGLAALATIFLFVWLMAISGDWHDKLRKEEKGENQDEHKG